jgi:hypothetical protein
MPVAPVEAPSFTPGSKLVLFNKPGNPDSDKLSVGDPSTMVDKRFLPDNATVSRELPKGFDNYTGESFDENGSGFGVIFYRVPGSDSQGGTPEVVMAMKHETGLNKDDVDSTVQAYETSLDSLPTSDKLSPITGPNSSYYFWDDAEHKQRLMICYVMPRQDSPKLNLTVALGDVSVMNKLRMDPVDAKKDSAAVQKLLPAAQPVR